MRILFITLFATVSYAQTNYRVGVGRYDITGPAAEVNMMGYANPAQKTYGIHLRQYSRAFIIDDGKSRIVFVNVDACMISDVLKMQVVEKLKKKFGSVYDYDNVCLSGIHTHSGPAGFHQYLLLDITSLGFVKETLNALTDGIIMSISIAHERMQPGSILMNSGQLTDANINRSPAAYLRNPVKERNAYSSNVDTQMTVLKFVDSKQSPIGMISWFPVHCTSMNNTNGFISSDNKGLASLHFEQQINGPNFLPGQGDFVAAFAQANEGDVSPNTKGPHCLDSGKPCDFNTSTCHGKNELCVAFGPGKDMFESTRIIAHRQMNKAMELFKHASQRLSGPVSFQHQFVDMTNVSVKVNTTYTARTCKAAMGYSFAAGTMDGPGMFDFKQGSTSGSPVWNAISHLLSKPSKEQIRCQHPKPILLNTGEMNVPYKWQQDIVATQILRIGQLLIVAVPGEFTTMAGRRVKNLVTEQAAKLGMSDVTPVIAGLSNTYANYITTFEEYQQQRYEGASTVYGPYTLQAYLNQYASLTTALLQNRKLPMGPPPPNLLSKQLSFLSPVVFDGSPIGKTFGSVLREPKAKYLPGDIVNVEFVSGNPRNDMMANRTFLTVEQLTNDMKWKIVYTDSNWETKFKWTRTSTLLGESKAEISWETSESDAGHTYRIRHFGHAKHLLGSIVYFKGATRNFSVIKKHVSFWNDKRI